ncbi:cell division protein ZapE [Marinagarivorans cellulosilyticus]|uniref:Cell division protein ZapE n=1 Tax=Marinagarivorans cellulosilyticus TaxID=2721545 RepID=A0AAN2BK36_9GAMM|nr:cell division protein ZapE [Marinagarivorans cellulosilyticus]BCD97591.1 cell division protein ZapE [Marinagarivorans cellulosilyticus]
MSIPHSVLTPQQRYQQDLSLEGFVADSAQVLAVEALDGLCERLLAAPKQSFVHRLFKRPQEPVKGLYLWGGVGRGKTYLMDLFFDALPFEQKMRTHFHRFMRRVHDELAAFAGEKNPLEKVAEKIAAQARVICFDEFFVTDITDAMLLAGLLDALFMRGVTLVATSNIAPQGLYENGLQRSNFLPAIDLLLKNTTVLNVDGGVDYRLRLLKQASLYYVPHNEVARQAMSASFERLAPDAVKKEVGAVLMIEGRPIKSVQVAEDVAWFSFKALCDGPRSQRDYIELAREFHAVIVSDVPELGVANDDQARRFIYMVDEFYDRGVKLVVSAARPIAGLYKEGGRLAFEFQRTQSRLLEMQSEEYLARAHKP